MVSVSGGTLRKQKSGFNTRITDKHKLENAMKDSLFVEQQKDGHFYLRWWIAEDQDEGGLLGESLVSVLGSLSHFEQDEKIAMHVARVNLGKLKSGEGFYWETKGAALIALKAIKVAWKDADAMKAKKANKAAMLARLSTVAEACANAGISAKEAMDAVKIAFSVKK